MRFFIFALVALSLPAFAVDGYQFHVKIMEDDHIHLNTFWLTNGALMNESFVDKDHYATISCDGAARLLHSLAVNSGFTLVSSVENGRVTLSVEEHSVIDHTDKVQSLMEGPKQVCKEAGPKVTKWSDTYGSSVSESTERSVVLSSGKTLTYRVIPFEL